MTATIDEKLGFIFGRRSIRAYTAEAVSDEAVQKLLEAAMAAPSAAATDPWRFVVIKNRDMLARIAAALPYEKMLGSAAAEDQDRLAFALASLPGFVSESHFRLSNSTERTPLTTFNSSSSS
jgi:nitroreductase